MFEKVNPMHPDKIADRISGALVDLAYSREENPKVAVEVLIGHGYCYVIAESSVEFKHEDVEPAVTRIVGKPLTVRLLSIPQDAHLAQNQADGFRCGDNGIFKGTPVTREQQVLTSLAHTIYGAFPTDGKYVGTMDGSLLRHTICQSNATEEQLTALYEQWAQGEASSLTGMATSLRVFEPPLRKGAAYAGVAARWSDTWVRYSQRNRCKFGRW